MFRSFSRKLFTFLVTAVLVAFVSVYLHGCQSSSEPSTKTPQASPLFVSSSPSPSSTPSPSDCDESDQPDCHEKRSTLDWILGAYATLGNSYQGFIVDFHDNAPDVNKLGQVNNLQLSDILPNEKTYLIQGGLEELNKLKDSGLAGYIRYIEPNYLYKQTSSLSANDPYYPKQWNLKDIKIEEAWKITQGDGITVAILDSGVVLVDDFSPDTFTQGYDFVSIPSKPVDLPSRDPKESSGNNPHGTNLAGIIAQATNNSLGFAGIAPKAKIMSVRVLDEKGIGDADTITKGIKWAVNNGADVINCSFAIINEIGSNTYIRDAIEYAKSKGVVVVAAAGNDGKQEVLYPASDQNAIAVAAYTPNLTRASYSNYGDKVAIFAPGGQGIPNSLGNKSNIDSLEQSLCQEIGIATNNPLMNVGITQSWTIKNTRRGNKYESLAKGQVCSGTSQATAGVSGVVALIKATGVKNPDTIKKILVASSQKDCKEPEDTSSLDRQTPIESPITSRNSFEPGTVGRLDAGTAVQIAKSMINPKVRNNIALARYLKKIGAKVYGDFTCSPNSIYNTIFGKAAFSDLNYLEVPKHNREEVDRGWEIKGELHGFVRSLEKLADLSGYPGSRNFDFSDEYKSAEEQYKLKKEYEAKQKRSQSTRH